MATVIAMPKLGMTMQEGTVVEWPLALGDVVEKGRTVVVIESEKTQVDIEASENGVLRHLYVEAGETVPCGTVLGAIAESMDEPFDAEAFREQQQQPLQAAKPAAAVRVPGTVSAAVPARTAGAVPVTPAARALARSLGIDPSTLAGTGPGGRITKEDVEAFASRRERLVEVAPGVSLEVLREGSGEPVLLLPGFGVGVASFAPQMQALAAAGGFEAIGVHPRGVGASDAPPADVYDVATGAADAAAIAEKFGGSVHVVGASLGSAVAMEMAMRFPQRVRSLTLVTPLVVATPRLLAVLDAWRAVAREGNPDLLSRVLLPWLFSQAVLRDDKIRERMRRGLASALAVATPNGLDRWAAGLAAWSGTRDVDLGRMAVPTLVIAAGADLLTPRGEALGKAIPAATVRLLDSVGHAAASEAGTAVGDLLVEHLRRY